MNDEDNMNDNLAYVAAHTRASNGNLLIEEIIGRAGLIRAARKAKWTPRMIAALEEMLISALVAFHEQCQRLEQS